MKTFRIIKASISDEEKTKNVQFSRDNRKHNQKLETNLVFSL